MNIYHGMNNNDNMNTHETLIYQKVENGLSFFATTNYNYTTSSGVLILTLAIEKVSNIKLFLNNIDDNKKNYKLWSNKITEENKTAIIFQFIKWLIQNANIDIVSSALYNLITNSYVAGYTSGKNHVKDQINSMMKGLD